MHVRLFCDWVMSTGNESVFTNLSLFFFYIILCYHNALLAGFEQLRLS